MTGRRYAIAGGVVILTAGLGIGIYGAMSLRRPATQAEIAEASRAPFVAFARKDARALCESFTPSAANSLAHKQMGVDCATRVREVFADSSSVNERLARTVVRLAEPIDIAPDGNVAHVELRFGKRGSGVGLQLERVDRRWRIATLPVLALVPGCNGRPGARPCSPNSHVVVFGLNEGTTSRRLRRRCGCHMLRRNEMP